MCISIAVTASEYRLSMVTGGATLAGRVPPPPPPHQTPRQVFTASTKDPSLPIQNSDHVMLTRCAALCAACSFRRKN
ncbi:hypothetical protein J6590_031436 [Homalodisca vitripennis]|nr:hypothetical protein J6590_031436 [Homalodisca vitripennis]